MTYVKWTFFLVIAGIVGAFLHYTLPQNDIVRIVGTENRRIDFGDNSIFWASPDAGTQGLTTRDVRFIETVKPSGGASVYRNEDTGWGWPPYFKLDSSNLQAEARDLISTSAAPQWVAVTHYGWRSEFLTIFPNAISVRAVAGPDTTFIPWFNIVFLTILAAILWALTVRLIRFRRNRIDPILEDAGEAWDDAGDAVERKRKGFRSWLDQWKGKPRG
ncbi:Protein of unknown function [Jannaschia faecimaris]|uniref:DUF1523 domain-containing protein n=1 Tax=Jannaschia faecimaris TaxID=1244108 RepID=A0A1H3PJV5_9RHOB|nr:DUF1523 family protein [Jannaschia faecimaris]SDZ01367.1 Protein of unknown function [Jannaschia faecimaris]